MTTATASSSFCSVRPVTPTVSDRFLLWASRAVESFALTRMQRRAGASSAADAASDERRTALALGAVGILPR
ncbi:MAG: hypothetical protein EOO67_19545 [Microbacterium sp.]|nr:MAG: hypothetical protein EOO67_19545 [Microbacterium sp.]